MFLSMSMTNGTARQKAIALVIWFNVLIKVTMLIKLILDNNFSLVHSVHSTCACGKSFPKIVPMAKLDILYRWTSKQTVRTITTKNGKRVFLFYHFYIAIICFNWYFNPSNASELIGTCSIFLKTPVMNLSIIQKRFK